MRRLISILAVALASACGNGAPAPSIPTDSPAPLVTPHTVRLEGRNVYAAAAAVTQATYGATHHEDRPHAVTLVRSDRFADALLGASRITHFPVNSTVLYVEMDRIPQETFDELKRLGPDGNTYDRKVQVYLVGPISEAVEKRIHEELGFSTRAFRYDDPFALSEALDTWAGAVHADHPDEVIVVQFDRLDTGLPAGAWNAHMGHGLVFVQGELIPEPTRRVLQRRHEGEAFIYLFGDDTIISRQVAEALAAYGHVQRIPGASAAEIAITFAGYRDAGLDQGYWIGSWARDFGWGIAEAGHNFTFVNPVDWQVAVTGSLLSHMGKHGPMILLDEGRLSESARRYLDLVRPARTSPADQLVNHGWILGSRSQVPWEVQADIDMALGPAVQTAPVVIARGKPRRSPFAPTPSRSSR